MAKLTGNKGFTISELLLVFTAAVIIVGVLLPVMYINRVKMDKTLCAGNLYQVGLALYIYAREHNGSFPSDLKTLYDEQYLADEKLMDCPASKETGGPNEPDYAYVPGLSVKDASLKVLMRDKNGNHQHAGGNALYVNGAVVWEKQEN